MTSMALFPYPRRFHGAPPGALPAASVAPGPEGVTPDADRVPGEAPLLPVVVAARGLELRGLPVALAGQADVHAGDGTGARQAFPRTVYVTEDRAGLQVGDAGAYAHQRDGLVGAVGPLVDVVTVWNSPL